MIINRHKIFVVLLLLLGAISLFTVGLDFLALTDIYHGREPDLSAEWWIISRSFVPIVLFIILALVFIGRDFSVRASKSPD